MIDSTNRFPGETCGRLSKWLSVFLGVGPLILGTQTGIIILTARPILLEMALASFCTAQRLPSVMTRLVGVTPHFVRGRSKGRQHLW